MKTISKTLENYNYISNDIKFLPNSMIRLNILKNLYEFPMNMKDINHKTKINYSAISNNMHALELKGFIYRENSGYYLSNVMRVYMGNILKLDALMILLERLSPVLQEHIVQALPRESIENLHYLHDVNLIEADGLNIYKTYELIEKSIDKSNYVNAILPFSYNNFNDSLNNLLLKNKKIHLISPLDIKEILIKNLDASNDNLKIDFFDFNEFDYLLLLCTDKNMMLGFFKEDGNYDQNRLLTSTDGDCIKWANELFENFKKEKNM